MPGQLLEPPAHDELEISFFGPGYGEAICLHLGGGAWVIVDSCLHPNTSEPAPLYYLDHIGVNAQQAVKLIVATHWHDDHIRGIYKVAETCEAAALAMPQALSHKEFLRLVELYSTPTAMDRIQSGMGEFADVFRLLKERRQRSVRFNAPLLAVADRILLHRTIDIGTSTVEATMASLSPSDEANLQASLALGRLWPQHRQAKKRIASPSPNHASIVLWCEVGQHRLLLGADLERSANPHSGWTAILTGSQVTNGKAGLFKVPHHGSENAHDGDVWSHLLSPDPVALISPYQRSRQPLPTARDLDRIMSLTTNGFITTRPPQARPSDWRNKVVRDAIRQATKTMQAVDIGWGHICVRQKIADPPGAWDVRLYGDAQRLRRPMDHI